MVEARFAGLGGSRDTHIDLVDVSTNEYIMLGDTNYLSWGFYTQGSGKFNFKEVSSWAGSHNGINVATNGITTNQFKEYRITIDVSTVKVERGSTLENITETMTKTLGSSIVGRTFYLRIGTASTAHSPGTHDWVRVATY